MRLVGLLGGMSWESTAEYYRLMNQAVRQRLGAQHSARLLLYSVDFEEIAALQTAGAWEQAGRLLGGYAQQLEAAGAEGLVLCTNTMHKVAPAIEAVVTIPLLHIADATATCIQVAELRRVGLLGTRFTMEQPFYRERLVQHGLEMLVPAKADRQRVHEVIYQELCQGQVRETSRQEYVRIIEALAERGAEGVILGCTEITLLIRAEDSCLPIFDTTRLHADAAVAFALAPESS